MMTTLERPCYIYIFPCLNCETCSLMALFFLPRPAYLEEVRMLTGGGWEAQVLVAYSLLLLCSFFPLPVLFSLVFFPPECRFLVTSIGLFPPHL